MENKCYLTTYRERANNPEIPFLNEFRIEFVQLANPQTGSHRLRFYFYRTVIIDVIKGSGTFTINGGTPTDHAEVTGDIILEASNENFTIIISNRFDISSIRCDLVDGWINIKKGWLIDISQLDFNNVWYVLTLVNRDNVDYGNIFTCNRPDATKETIQKLQVSDSIDINSFVYNGNGITAMTNIYSSGKKSIGNIEDLSCYPSLTNLTFRSKSVIGDIDTLFSAMAANRTSGSLVVDLDGAGCTDEGNIITLPYIISKGGSWAIRATFNPSAPNGYTKEYV